MPSRAKAVMTCVLVFFLMDCGLAADWPQLQNDPQHSGYSPEYVGPPYGIAWSYKFTPEQVYTATQAVIVDGTVFVGTKHGTLFALDALTGGDIWTFEAQGGIYHTVAVENGLVFFGAMDGCVYAVNATTGLQQWKTVCEEAKLGFSAACVIADGKVFIGNRSGCFFCLDQATGAIIWTFQCEGPIFQAAGYAPNGSIAFCAEDMYMYILDASSGNLQFRSRKLQGQSFRDNYAMIHQGKVIVRAMHVNDTYGVSGASGMFSWGIPTDYLTANYDAIISGSLPGTDGAQQSIINNYESSRSVRQDLFVFDVNTGDEIVVPQWGTGTMAGPIAPPAVWGDLLVVPVLFGRGAWGMLDLDTRRLTQALKEPSGDPPNLSGAGGGNNDEHLNVSVAGDTIFTLHVQEGNAHYTGSFDMNARHWTSISAGPSGGFFNNNQGGGGNAGSISNGMMYHIKYHCLIARQCTPK